MIALPFVDDIAQVIYDHDQQQAPRPAPKSMFADRHQLEYYARLLEMRAPQTFARCGDRIVKAIRLAYNAGNIYTTNLPGIYHVRGSHENAWYEVDMVTKSCTCLDHQDRGHGSAAIICKHRLAVGLLVHGPQWATDASLAACPPTRYEPLPIREARHKSENAWHTVAELLAEKEKLTDPNECRRMQRQINAATRAAQAAEKAAHEIYQEYYR